MIIFIDREFISFGARFFVKNEQGKVLFRIKGDFWSLKGMLHVFDANDNEVAKIYRVITDFLPRCRMERDGEELDIVKDFSLTNPRFLIEDAPFALEGDFLAHKYELKNTDTGEAAAHIEKEWFAAGDRYTLDVPDEKNVFISVFAVVAADRMSGRR